MKLAALKAIKNIVKIIPILIGVLMLVNLVNPFLRDLYPVVFSGHYLLDPLIGAIMGSLSFGMPVVSFITGGELLEAGISLIAVTAFMLTWTTVGFVMLPLEINYLGKRFALIRNSVNFIFAIIIAVITVYVISIFA